jgi:hypothetical protein
MGGMGIKCHFLKKIGGLPEVELKKGDKNTLLKLSAG